ncbi:Hpt domain-containing protein [Thalassotalea crassostreae]|uniref:Hpt domain-containing protein n=1 Tax=Thalassotalea crassostreae TaxID=1763536 RepID=UPI000837BFFB|nr:Hpt domain-containing protein [Thalassotalea crassostreae]
MSVTTLKVKTPRHIITKAAIYVTALLAAMLILASASSWLYNQQAAKSDFLREQQIPFIKNNAQLMKSIAELENQLTAHQLAITHQQLATPLENVKQAWLEIVELSNKHVELVNDSLRDTTATEIASTAQTFANDYKKFVLLVDDLLLIRQARNGQYKANTKSLDELIKKINRIRVDKQNQLQQQSYEIANTPGQVKTQTINNMMKVINENNFYQYIYQELLKVESNLTALSGNVSAYEFNQISKQIANLTKNINTELSNKDEDDRLPEITDDIGYITSQLMGSGQLFAKWRDENITTAKVIEQLSNYQQFLMRTASLIEKPNFYDLPEFELNLPLLGIKIKESTMLPIVFLFIVILLAGCAFLGWRLMVLVNRSFIHGADHALLEVEKEQAAELAIQNAKVKHREQLKSIIDEPTNKELRSEEQNRIKNIEAETDAVHSPSFYQINNLVMDLDKFNQYHGSAEMAVFMLDDYMQRNKQNFQKLKDALANEQLGRVEEINAAIFKTAKILSAPRLIKVCEQLEGVCEQQDIHKAVPLLAEMNEAIIEINKFIAEA